MGIGVVMVDTRQSSCSNEETDAISAFDRDQATIDTRIARAIRQNLHAIAEAVIDTHDAQYPETNLRTIAREQRMQWVEQNVSYIASSIEAGEVVTWSYSYIPNVVGGFDPATPPYVEVSNAYETQLALEDCMLPFVWAEFEGEPDLLLDAVRRFRYHMLRFIDANVEAVQIELGHRLRESLADASESARAEVMGRMGPYLSRATSSLAQKLALIYDSVQDGRAQEALALVTATRLLVGDVAEKTMALMGDAAVIGTRAASTPAFPPATTPAPIAPEPSATPAPAGTPSEPAATVSTPFAAPTAGQAASPIAIAEPSPVTRREADVLRGVVAGKTNAEIAVDLALSIGTVRNYISTLLEKLQAENRTQLAIRAVKAGIE